MARCCNGGSNTLIEVGDRLSITGTGRAQDPSVIGLDLDLEVVDSATFNLGLTGTGTVVDPWTLSVAFASTASINDFPDVDTSGKANGKGLIYNSSTLRWEAQTVPTAAPGAVSSDTSISGDGSVGAPLEVTHDPDRYTSTDGDGIGLTPAGITRLVLRFADASTRTALLTAPTLNQVTMLDDHPGQQDYWTGTQWKPVSNGVDRDFGSQFMAISGAYVSGLPITLITRSVVATTDAAGNFDLLDTADLSGAAGVLSCHFQEAGAVPYKAMMFDNIDHVSATAYRLDDGTPLVSQAISGVVLAYVY
jgi:hypothetical protein